MYPQWLLTGLSFPDGDIEQQLRAARALVPAKLMADCGLEPELADCLESGHFHFALECAQNIGIWAEGNDQDGELPPEFWARLASAADGMSFPQFVPYCLGKAHRLPGQDAGDLMAAFATLPQVDGVGEQLRSWSDQAAATLRRGDPATIELIANRDLDALAARLREGTYDRLGQELSESFSEAFDDLFELVVDPKFPAEHRKHAWAVIGANTFRVVLGGGLLPLTEAEVWWRAG